MCRERSWGTGGICIYSPSLRVSRPRPWNSQLFEAEAGRPSSVKGPSLASDFMLQAFIPRMLAREPSSPTPLLLTELEQTQG